MREIRTYGSVGGPGVIPVYYQEIQDNQHINNIN